MGDGGFRRGPILLRVWIGAAVVWCAILLAIGIAGVAGRMAARSNFVEQCHSPTERTSLPENFCQNVQASIRQQPDDLLYALGTQSIQARFVALAALAVAGAAVLAAAFAFLSWITKHVSRLHRKSASRTAAEDFSALALEKEPTSSKSGTATPDRRAATPVRLNWRRGLFRTGVVVTVVWWVSMTFFVLLHTPPAPRREQYAIRCELRDPASYPSMCGLSPWPPMPRNIATDEEAWARSNEQYQRERQQFARCVQHSLASAGEAYGRCLAYADSLEGQRTITERHQAALDVWVVGRWIEWFALLVAPLIVMPLLAGAWRIGSTTVRWILTGFTPPP